MNTTHRIRLLAVIGTVIAASALAMTWTSVSSASTPGVDWVTQTTPTPVSSWRGVTYGNGRWVAVADNAVMTSTDGTSWATTSGVPTGRWRAVHFAQGLFVAVGYASANSVMTSADGEAWTVRATASSLGFASASDAELISVTYGNGRWVVANNLASASAAATMVTSTDGLTWTTNDVTKPAGSTVQQAAVLFGDGTFVLVYRGSSNKAIATSTDGLAWTERNAPDSGWRGIAYGNGTFVAVGLDGSSSADAMYSSDKGATWSDQTTGTGSASYAAVAYGNGLFVALASQPTLNNEYMTSPDGINWTVRVPVADESWQGVAWAFGQFVAVSNSGANRAMTSGTITQVDLTVAKSGDGTGTVTSEPAGIDCGPTCTKQMQPGTVVSLTAKASSGSSFTGWTDGCSGTATTCVISVDTAMTVTATFTKDAAAGGAPTAGTTAAPLTIARASGNASMITTTIRATTPGRAVMTGTVGGKPAFKPGKHVFTTPSTATIRAALNDRVRALLRIRDVRVKITVRFIAADGRTTTSTRTVLLKKITVRPEPVTG